MKAFLLKYRSSLLLFAVMFLFGWGSAAVVAKWQSDRETEETMHIEAAVDNWGLGFGESGKELQPTGNATADELKQYDTYYIGSKEEKVIYLTFDCGYENGNTGAILCSPLSLTNLTSLSLILSLIINSLIVVHLQIIIYFLMLKKMWIAKSIHILSIITVNYI